MCYKCVNTQEQREGLTLRCGRNWSFPASVKIEGSEYLLLHSTKDKIYRSDWCALTICFLPSVGLLRVLALRCFSWFLGFRCVKQNPRIPRLELREIVQATACVSFFLCFLHVRCTAHFRQQCVHANLANRPSHISCNSFSKSYDRPVRPGPLTTVGRTSLSVIIIIIIIDAGGRQCPNGSKTAAHQSKVLGASMRGWVCRLKSWREMQRLAGGRQSKAQIVACTLSATV